MVTCPRCGKEMRSDKKLINHFRNEHMSRKSPRAVPDAVRRIKICQLAKQKFESMKK